MIIDQFMWGFQPHFQTALEASVKSALDSIGVVLAPVALLIGFEEEPGGHEICVEPEGAGINPATLDGCLAEGDAKYDSHRDRRMHMSDPGLHTRFHANLRDRCRAEAIADALASVGNAEPRHWIVGLSARVDRYRVYPVIGVLRGKWDALPTLAHRESDHRVEMFLSLQESVIREVLRRASFALSTSGQPLDIPYSDSDEVVRRATKNFIDRLVYFKGGFMGGGLDSAMNLIAAQPYEGRAGAGTMLMAKRGECSIGLEFTNPISLKLTRAVRKALEMTSSELHLVTDGTVAIGLGVLADNYDSEAETAFLLRVLGRAYWELQHAGVPLLAVSDGHATVPRERLSRETFRDAVLRLFGSSGDGDRLWALALAAADQAHGTMLVVHADAESEASRLAPPAMRVEPSVLEESTLSAVSAIDGAVVVDPSGRCHGVGVILDGRARSTMGDASRGARYNSAHRYLAEATRPCLIIIVSEDGMIDLIPELPRRIKKSQVNAVLSEVESLSKRDPVDFRQFFKREQHLRSLSFYLTAEQCDRANAARRRVEDYRELAAKRSGKGVLRVSSDAYEPNSQLDNSVFLPE